MAKKINNPLIKLGMVPLASVSNKNWKVIFTPSAELTSGQVSNLFNYLLPGLLALIVALGGVVFVILKIIKSLRAETTQLRNQMADVINDHFIPSDSYQFPDFLELDTILAKMGKKEAEQKEVPKLKVKPVKKADDDAEMVDIEMLDDETVEDELPEDEEYDVKCTRHLNSVISGFGGKPIIASSGHLYIKEKMTEAGDEAGLGYIQGLAR